ncbi:MAG: hypothetical protein ABIE03_02055 [Patescibacteria group bacterium]|nr:hypothetical protein [Patescibacteria group bacterium]
MMNKKQESEIESKIESVIEDTAKKGEKFFEKAIGRVVGFVVTIIVNIVILVVINYYYEKFSFLTTEFPEWLPYANASIFAAIIVQVLILVIPSKTIKPFFEIFSNIFSLVSVVALRLIYPFDWAQLTDGNWADTVAKIGMVGVILAVFIAIIANAVKFAVAVLGGKSDETGDEG